MKKFWLKTVTVIIVISMLLSVNVSAESGDAIDIVLNSGDVVEVDQYYVGRSEEGNPNFDPNFKYVNKVTFNAFGSEPIIVKSYGFSGLYVPVWVNEIVFNGTGDIILGSGAFAITNITDLNLPSNVKFEDEAYLVFYESNVRNVTIGCDICEGMFEASRLETVTFTADNDISEIPERAFYDTKLKKIEIPSSVKRIGNEAFLWTPLAEIKLNEGLETIGNSVFYDNWSSFKKITLPSTVKSIGSECFYTGDDPYDIELNDGLVSVGKRAFIGKFDNKSVTIPASVTLIGEKAFGYDSNEEKAENFTIYGYRGTAAETYADENGFAFIPLDDESSVNNLKYTPSWSSVNDYSFTVDGRADKVQIIEATGATRTFTRNNANVAIKCYDTDGNEVSSLSRELDHEVWTIRTRLTPDSNLKIHAKYNSVWEDQMYDFSISTLYSDTSLKSAELFETSGKQSTVACKIVTGSGVSKVRIEYEDGMTTTVNSSAAVLDETNMTCTYNLSVNPRHSGENAFKVYIKTPSDGWIYATTLTYTAE